jgi:hypothetical protein
MPDLFANDVLAGRIAGGRQPVGSICLALITLMWMESVLALCLGGEIHALLARRGWARSDEAYQACAVTSPSKS